MFLMSNLSLPLIRKNQNGYGIANSVEMRRSCIDRSLYAYPSSNKKSNDTARRPSHIYRHLYTTCSWYTTCIYDVIVNITVLLIFLGLRNIAPDPRGWGRSWVIKGGATSLLMVPLLKPV